MFYKAIRLKRVGEVLGPCVEGFVGLEWRNDLVWMLVWAVERPQLLWLVCNLCLA